MNARGRVSLLGILGLLSLLVVGGVLFFAQESLSSVAARFMTALAKKDVETLSKMSFLGKRSPEEVQKAWEFSVNTAGRYYNFNYKITSSTQADATNGMVRMQLVRDSDSPSAYEEKMELPLVKIGNEWKVDVGNMPRSMYPGLPR